MLSLALWIMFAIVAFWEIVTVTSIYEAIMMVVVWIVYGSFSYIWSLQLLLLLFTSIFETFFSSFVVFLFELAVHWMNALSFSKTFLVPSIFSSKFLQAIQIFLILFFPFRWNFEVKSWSFGHGLVF